MLTRADELQFISDALALEWLFPEPQVKQAGIIDDLFGSLKTTAAAQMQEFGKKNLSPDQPGGIAGGLLEMIATGAFWYISRPLTIAWALASQVLGINLRDIAIGIVNAIKPHLESGQATPQTVDQATKAALAGNEISIAAIIKEADWGRRRKSTPDEVIDFFKSHLRQRSATKLFTAIVGFAIKCLLIGAGITAGASALVGAVGLKPEDRQKTETTSTESGTQETPTESTQPEIKPTFTAHKLQPSGRGEQYFTNDENNFWIVRLINGSIENTLVTWAIDVYPELSGYEQEIKNSPYFRRAVSLLKGNWSSSSPNRLLMPKSLNSRKETVDIFSADVAKLIVPKEIQ